LNFHHVRGAGTFKEKYHAEYAALGFSVFMNEGRLMLSLGF